jgi:CobQ/CobB/MinD/ParA nucleotide binding domain
MRHPNDHAFAARASQILTTSDSTQLLMNKQINLIINCKGGVGKSFFATNFVQYLKDCGIAHCAIDSDHENSTPKRFHPVAEFINLQHRREIDRVFTTAETSDLLVIDCRAASTDLLIDFFDEVNFAEILRSLGARPTVISHVKVDWPILTNLRLGPFERTGRFNGKDNDLSFIPPGGDLSSGAWS